MKRFSRYRGVISVLLVILISFTAGCVKVVQDSDPSTKLSSSSSSDFKIYTDDANGFSIAYPGNWIEVPIDAEQKEQGALAGFKAPKAEHGFIPNFNVVIEDMEAEYSVETYYEATLRHIKTAEGYSFISDENINVNGIPGLIHIFSTEIESSELISIQAYLISGRYAWIITCISPVESFDSLKPTLYSIIDSFELAGSGLVSIPVSGPASSPALSTHADPQDGFSISYPADWSLMPEEITPTDDYWVLATAYWAPKADYGFTPEFAVWWERLDAQMSVETYFDIVVRDLRSIPGYRLISQDSVTINGVPAIIHVSAEASDHGELMYFEGYFVQNGTAWIIQCACHSDSYDSLGPVFESMVDSFRLTGNVPDQPSSQTNPFMRITMTTGVNDNMEPFNEAYTFHSNTPEIICAVKLGDVPAHTEVTAEWIYLEGVEPERNYTIGDYTLEGESWINMAFSLSRPDKGWPIGDYEVVLYVNGVPEQRVPFYVR